jgi:acyl-coenzyme A thioesterase PaaI-like protein
VRLAAGARLLATAEPVRIGRNIGLVDIRVTDDEDTLVAAGRCVFSTQDRGS